MTSTFLHSWNDCLRYQVSLALVLPDTLTREVEQLRARLTCSVGRTQAVPHLTLAYIGVREGSDLEVIAKAMGRICPAPLRFGLEGVGSFTTDGTMTNIHLSVTPADEVIGAHARALDVLTTLGEHLDTPFKGSLYVPHITVLDGICSPVRPAEMEELAAFRWRGQAGALCLMGKPVAVTRAG